jgi:MoxR-like ATPase
MRRCRPSTTASCCACRWRRWAIRRSRAAAALTPGAPARADHARRARAKRAGQARTVTLGDEALAALAALRAEAAAQGLTVSDRRWRQLVALMRSAAATEGRAALDTLDLWLVPYVVGDSDDSLCRAGRLGQRTACCRPRPSRCPGWTMPSPPSRSSSRSSTPAMPRRRQPTTSAGKLALARSLAQAPARPGGMLRIVSATLEARQRRHFSPVHVAARLAQVDAVAARADAARATVQAAA